MTALCNDHIGFVHVPKTGGSWVARAMKQAGVEVQVLGERTYGHVPHNEVPGPFKFGFVRNPLTWYPSWWAHFHSFEFPLEGPIQAATKQLSFPEFVHYMARKHPGFLGHFYTGYLGQPGEIDFIGLYERLAQDLQSALLRAGQPFDANVIKGLKPVNEGRNKPAVTSELARIIIASERATMVRFRYEPEPVAA